MIAPSRVAPAGDQGDLREAGAVRITGRRQLRLGRRQVELRTVVRAAVAWHAERNHARRRNLERVGQQSHDPVPVDAHLEGPPDVDVVERRLRRVEAVELDRRRRFDPQRRTERRVVRDPGCVVQRDRGVVEVAGLELGDRALAADAAEQVDRGDGGSAGPVVRVGGQGRFGGGHRRQDVGAAADERAGFEQARVGVEAGRYDCQRRTRRDGREVGRRAEQVYLDVGCIDRLEADPRGRPGALTVGPGTDHVIEQRRQLAGLGGREHAHPARHDVRGAQRRPVREHEPRSKVEDDLFPAILGCPAGGQGRLHAARRVDGRQRLEDLRNDLGAAGVRLDAGSNDAAEGPRIVTLVLAAAVLEGCHAALTATAIASATAAPAISSRRCRPLPGTSADAPGCE